MNNPSLNLSYSYLHLVQEIERYAYHTWPAAAVVPYGDWFMRASGGITKRANSIWTSSGIQLPDGDWVEATEQFYESQGLPVCYHISDASPDGVDAILASKGYVKQSPCSVFIADTKPVIERSRCEPRDIGIHLQPIPDEQWLSDFLQLEGFTLDKYAFYDDLFSRINYLKSFCSLTINGNCVAIGTVVVENGWAGLTNIVVKNELRGQGIGKLLIHSLAEWSQSHGASRIYLQVMDENESAHRLYEKAGFAPLYPFHYRIKER